MKSDVKWNHVTRQCCRVSFISVPSDELSNHIAKTRLRFPVRKVFVLAAAFVLVALALYKAGQWSSISEEVPSQDGEKLGDQLQRKPSSDNTMSGKYSVG